jgi:acyl-coenzyme A thioesterase PaaI-like protein
VIAEARLLKLGRRLAYGEVLLLSDGEADPVAHATGTYSIPPDRPSP